MCTKIKRGQILRSLRLKRQLTQNEAAENFGISQQTYQKYESGKTEPPYDLLCDFAVFYGVTTDYLLGQEPANPLLDMPTKSINDDEFIDMYESLPTFAKEIFVEVMARLSKAAQENIKQKKVESPPVQLAEKTYPIRTAARRGNNGYFSSTTEDMTESEIQELLNAEDADEDL